MTPRLHSPFQILSEPVRLYIVELLCVTEQTSGDLATMCFSQFGVGWSAVSEHLSVLRAAGFVRTIRDDARRWYHLVDDWLDLPQQQIDRLADLWVENSANREIGFAHALGDHDWREIRSLSLESSKTGQRGRCGVDRADYGAERSEYSWYADGGGID